MNAITDGRLLSRRCLLRVEMCEHNAVVFGLLVVLVSFIRKLQNAISTANRV